MRFDLDDLRPGLPIHEELKDVENWRYWPPEQPSGCEVLRKWLLRLVRPFEWQCPVDVPVQRMRFTEESKKLLVREIDGLRWSWIDWEALDELKREYGIE